MGQYRNYLVIIHTNAFISNEADRHGPSDYNNYNPKSSKSRPYPIQGKY